MKIWLRDKGTCIRCGSSQIIGEPYKKGSHHIISRGVDIRLLLAEENNCLLCYKCHNANADTVHFRQELFAIMHEKYPWYDYSQMPYAFYFKEKPVQI